MSSTELTGRLAGMELGPGMAALKSERHRVFAFLVGSGMTETNADAAKEAGFAAPYRQSAYQLLQKEHIAKAVEEVARQCFRTLIGRAVRRAGDIIADKDHPENAKVTMAVIGKFISDRTSVDVNVSGQVQLSHTEAALLDLAQMLEMQMPHDALVSAFGEAGLARYSAMLKSAPKQIEHIPAAAGAVEAARNPMQEQKDE